MRKGPATERAEIAGILIRVLRVFRAQTMQSAIISSDFSSSDFSAEFTLQHFDHEVVRGVDFLVGQRSIRRAIAQRERD